MMKPSVVLPLFATGCWAFDFALGTTTLINTAICEGVTTYTGEVPLKTVTETVEEGYMFTSTINASMPGDIFYTALPPCETLIVPEVPETTSTRKPSESTSTYGTTTATNKTSSLTSSTSTVEQSIWTTICSTSYAFSNYTRSGVPYANSSVPVATTCSSTYYISSWSTVVASSHLATSSSPGEPKTSNQGYVPTGTETQAFSMSISSAPSQTAGKQTAVTVTVTKKTPVPAPNSGPSDPAVKFPGDTNETDGVAKPNENTDSPTPTGAQPTNRPDPQPTNNSPNSNNNAGTQGNNQIPTSGANNQQLPSNGNNPQNPTNGNSQQTRTNGNNQQNPTNGGQAPTNGATNQQNPNNSNNQQNPTNAVQDPTSAGNNNAASQTGNGLGSIINSAFNSPWTSVGVVTSFGAATPTVNLVDGVPVQVGSSSVYIGGSYVALPTGTSTVLVTINGQTFSVGPDVVIGATNTLSFGRSESISYSAVQAASLAASTIIQDGVTITISAGVAVVSGTSYSIGLNADETTVVINSRTITFNSNGVEFPSTTFLPAITTAPAYVVTTVGSLTITINLSQAIIDGTTYRIGAGSLNTVTTEVIDGTTVVFGPSGVVLPSTTIVPTGVSLTVEGSSTASAATRVVSDPGMASSTSGGGTGTTISRPPTYLSSGLCVIVMVLMAGMLPISLLL